ncbi:MAG: M6 family metalloprotease domain-containing protein [Bacteroidaceae bacterium]|nr:M6 family metalloprotease domain-containing protein [Bacteroidaceae bacterium]
MKKIITLTAALLVALSAAAIPAKPVKRTLTLTDGTTITATLRGDENLHYYVTDDGRALTECSDGTFQFADEQAIRTTWQQRLNRRNSLRLARHQHMRTSTGPRREFGVPGRIVGEKRGLVILVNFNGKSMKHTRQEFDDQFNQTGYSKNSHIGSVRDYFYKQSYEQLTIDFDVVGPYTLAHNMEYYGRNASFTVTSQGMIKFNGWSTNGDDVNAFEMVYEACKAADPEVDFADYDWDGNGKVDQVYVIYAGYGEAQGASSNTIWPHEYELSMAALYTGMPDGYPDLSTFANLRLDGVQIDTYACSNELNGTSGTTMDGIGTACHEFTHCLGLPDFYDVSYNGNFGMGEWDLMDSGSYNNDGNVPAAYTAYERWFSGWLEPIVIDGPATVNAMPAITDQPVCYVIYNEANRNEYYLLQNIQQTSWNKYAPGHGMLVQHIFYDKDVWQANEPNSTGYSTTSGNQYQRCTIIPADNRLNSYSLSGDTYPNGTNNSLSRNSTPAASLYVKNSDGTKYMNHPITEIAETNGLISFLADGGAQIEAPTAYEVEPEDIDESGFVASWSKVENAKTYTLELSQVEQPDQPDQSPLLFSEDFSGLQAVTSGTIDIAANLDNYLSMPGWTGSKVFSGYGSGGSGGAKLASATSPGRLQTPQLDAPASGTLTVYADGKIYGTDAMNLTVSIVTDAGVVASQTFTSGPMYLTADVTAPYSILFETPKATRYYLYTVKTADGHYTQNDMATMTDDVTTFEPVVTLIRTVTDVTDCYYYFADLDNGKYTFRVQAIDAEGNESEWSNSVEVLLEPATAIQCLPSLTDDATVAVYTLSGLRVKTAADAATWHLGLPRGTYILRSANATVKVAK